MCACPKAHLCRYHVCDCSYHDYDCSYRDCNCSYHICDCSYYDYDCSTMTVTAVTMTMIAVTMTVTAVTVITSASVHQRHNPYNKIFLRCPSQQTSRSHRACDLQQPGGTLKVLRPACLILQVCCMHCTTSTYAPGFSRGALTGRLQRSALLRCHSYPACKIPC